MFGLYLGLDCGLDFVGCILLGFGFAGGFGRLGGFAGLFLLAW